MCAQVRNTARKPKPDAGVYEVNEVSNQYDPKPPGRPAHPASGNGKNGNMNSGNKSAAAENSPRSVDQSVMDVLRNLEKQMSQMKGEISQLKPRYSGNVPNFQNNYNNRSNGWGPPGPQAPGPRLNKQQPGWGVPNVPPPPAGTRNFNNGRMWGNGNPQGNKYGPGQGMDGRNQDGPTCFGCGSDKHFVRNCPSNPRNGPWPANGEERRQPHLNQ
jgi:hypothetical protein